MQPPSSGPQAGSPPEPEPDAHGLAALLLVESLIHGLAARSIISVAEAVSITEIAVNAPHPPPPSMQRATTLSTSLMASLEIDLPSHGEVDA